METKVKRSSPLAAVLYKEWLKTRYALLGIGAAWGVALLFNFVLVYRMVRLEGAPAAWEAVIYQGLNLLSTLRWLPLAAGLALGLAQFLPEVRQNRLKLTLHLPLSDARLLAALLGYGYALQMAFAAIVMPIAYLLLRPLFPIEIVNSQLQTALPWFVTGTAAYGLVAWICIEPTARRRVAYAVLGAACLYLGFLSEAQGAYSYMIWGQLLFALGVLPALCFGALARFREGATASDPIASRPSIAPDLQSPHGKATIKSVAYALLLLLGAFMLSLLLPYFYHLTLDKKYGLPFTVYSGVTGTFAIFEGGIDEARYRDDAGNVYTRSEFDSILPTIYYTQLLRDGRFPDSLFGVPVSIEDMSENFFSFHSRPEEINCSHISLYPISDTDPERVVVAAPREAFRWTGEGIEIVQMESNSIDARKTQQFQKALREVALPVAITVCNPESRKEYDNGYLLVDGNGVLWQLRQEHGAAQLRRLEAPRDEKIEWAWVTEYEKNTTLGYVATASGRMYRVDAMGGICTELPIGKFSPREESIMIFGNMFDQTVRIIKAPSIRYEATTSEPPHSALRSYTVRVPEDWVDFAARWLLPFEMSLSNDNSAYIYPRIQAGWGWRSLCLGVLLAAATVRISRGEQRRRRIFKTLGVLLLGIYLFIPLLVWRR